MWSARHGYETNPCQRFWRSRLGIGFRRALRNPIKITMNSAGCMPRRRGASELSLAVGAIVRKTFEPKLGRVWRGVMAADALIDTGAILALLDKDDGWHKACVDALRQLRLPLMTSEAVLTELFYMVSDTRKQVEAAWKFVRSGAISLAIIQHTELAEIHSLMSKYWDRPMDLADGTLVYLARRESLATVMTVDHADFNTYRIEGKRRFRILPSK